RSTSFAPSGKLYGALAPAPSTKTVGFLIIEPSPIPPFSQEARHFRLFLSLSDRRSGVSGIGERSARPAEQGRRLLCRRHDSIQSIPQRHPEDQPENEPHNPDKAVHPNSFPLDAATFANVAE